MPVDSIRARMLAGLHEAGFTDLVPAHLAVMRYPGPEDQRPSEVAAETGMSKQATNYLLGQLERLGYLTREEDPDDQRSKRIHLTARGRAAAQCIRATVAQIETELEQELGPKRLARLRRLLIRLNATETISDHRR
jgi:DNA-binding MarR family transcriptional regulator